MSREHDLRWRFIHSFSGNTHYHLRVPSAIYRNYRNRPSKVAGVVMITLCNRNIYDLYDKLILFTNFRSLQIGAIRAIYGGSELDPLDFRRQAERFFEKNHESLGKLTFPQLSYWFEGRATTPKCTRILDNDWHEHVLKLHEYRRKHGWYHVSDVRSSRIFKVLPQAIFEQIFMDKLGSSGWPSSYYISEELYRQLKAVADQIVITKASPPPLETLD